MADKVRHLNDLEPIVYPDTGRPTTYFMRMLLDRGGLLQSADDTIAQILTLNVVAGDGLDGGGTVQAAIDASPDTPEITIDANASDILDLITTTRGSILYRGAGSWFGLAPGTSGYVLTTSGAGTDPTWAVASGASVADGDKGDITVSGSGAVWTIDNDVVTNAKLANMATATFKGRVTASTGDPEDLTGTQATTLLNVFTSSLKGLAPASGGGTSNFLRADATWAVPADPTQVWMPVVDGSDPPTFILTADNNLVYTRIE